MVNRMMTVTAVAIMISKVYGLYCDSWDVAQWELCEHVQSLVFIIS